MIKSLLLRRPRTVPYIQEINELPPIKPGQVIIKVAYSPINPSDLGFIYGSYPLKTKPYPCTLGFEGSGTIIDADNSQTIGRRVSFFPESDSHFGAWSTYCTTSENSCYFLDDVISFQQASCLLINPLSVICLLEMYKQLLPNSLLLNLYGSSQLGQMLSKYCEHKKIRLINVYRNAEKIPIQKDLYVQHCLTHEIKDGLSSHPVMCLSATGSENAFDVLKILPPGSNLIFYGWMGTSSNNKLDIPNLIFENKKIYGFLLYNYLKDKRKNDTLVKEVLENQEIFSTKILKTFRLDEFTEALHLAGTMKGGNKILFDLAHPQQLPVQKKKEDTNSREVIILKYDTFLYRNMHCWYKKNNQLNIMSNSIQQVQVQTDCQYLQ